MIKKLKAIKDKKWFSIVSNTYVLFLTVFAIWMLFFDTNSVLIQVELNRQISDLESQKEFLQSELAKDSATIKALSSEDAIEKFAREKYHYQKDKEDLYLIEFQDSIEINDNE